MLFNIAFYHPFLSSYFPLFLSYSIFSSFIFCFFLPIVSTFFLLMFLPFKKKKFSR